MKTVLLSPTPEGIDKAADLLRNGGVVAIPTETVYGLAADARNPQAVTAIFKAKGRPADNPLIVHIADEKDWAPLVKEIPPKARDLAKAYWPGPLTMILPADPSIPKETTGGLSTVAVRFPDHPVAQAILLRCGCPLAAPSANRSGSPSPTSARRTMDDMDGRIDAVVEGGESRVGVESTVLDLSVDPPRLLRPGGITPAMIEEVVGPIVIDPAVMHQLKAGASAASPGMKYKHYAPKATVELVKGTPEAYVRYVNEHADSDTAALCFEEDADRLCVPAVTYGHRDDPMEQAHRVFDALRRLDEIGSRHVLAAAPRPQGVGLAVYNRLIRAAAFSVINTIRVVGLTGPSGSGKSTVAATWRSLGAAVVDADELAREIVAPGSECLAALAETFSASILRPDGSLDRAELAKRAFSSPEAAKQLNDLTHPPILALIRQRLEDAADAGFPVAVLDAPLLFEAGADRLCDHIVAVTAPAPERRRRLLERDHLTEEALQRRLSAQPEDRFYQRPGVTVLSNDADEASLRQKAARLWEDRNGWWPWE